MYVLIACEFSGRVRDAFIARGHDAVSCDLLPTEAPGPHYQGDVRDILHDGWDMMIAHPPCTYLAGSGLHWNKRVPGRAALTEEALEFVRLLLTAPIPRIALSHAGTVNPGGIPSRFLGVRRNYVNRSRSTSQTHFPRGTASRARHPRN